MCSKRPLTFYVIWGSQWEVERNKRYNNKSTVDGTVNMVTKLKILGWHMDVLGTETGEGDLINLGAIV